MIKVSHALYFVWTGLTAVTSALRQSEPGSDCLSRLQSRWVNSPMTKPSVLVVDQLDAISVVSARNHAVWSAFYELLDEVHDYPKMRLLFACRSFDLERDPQLRGLVDDQEQAERIPVGSLGEDVDPSGNCGCGPRPGVSCHQRQMEILATPLHLHLLLESANSGPVGFTSPRDLFEAFWEHKEQAVASQMGGDQDILNDAAGRLCDELSERERLEVPSDVLNGKVRSILASEGIVFVQDKKVRFFHESFFDYAFARAFVRSNKDLVQWLLCGEQHLFSRSQVRQVLEFLRGHESDWPRYRRTLKGVLAHSDIRFHIKKLVIDWLRALSNPTSDEWHIVEGLKDELGEHTWGVISNSVPWFDTLPRYGTMAKVA